MGILEMMVQDVYKQGRDMGFKPPPAKKDGLLVERTETPPVPPGTPGPPAPAGPTTPVRRPIGLAPGTGTGASFGGWMSGRGSPLR